MMDAKFVIYETASGRILREFQGTEEACTVNLGLDESAVQVPADLPIYQDLYWVDPAGTILEKLDYEFSAIPLPAVVEIEGLEYQCDTQPVISFDSPGFYIVKVTPPAQYLVKEFELEYTPQIA